MDLLGTVSHGTMREEDLLPAFMSTLEDLEYPELARLQAWIDKLIQDDWGDYDNEQLIVLEEGDKPRTSFDWASCIINTYLIWALNEYAPPYCYFGSHPGDGSDYGFWVQEDIREETEDILIVEDYVSEIQFEDIEFPIDTNCLHINDHGNMTLYDFNGKELWAIV